MRDFIESPEYKAAIASVSGLQRNILLVMVGVATAVMLGCLLSLDAVREPLLLLVTWIGYILGRGSYLVGQLLAPYTAFLFVAVIAGFILTFGFYLVRARVTRHLVRAYLSTWPMFGQGKQARIWGERNRRIVQGLYVFTHVLAACLGVSEAAKAGEGQVFYLLLGLALAIAAYVAARKLFYSLDLSLQVMKTKLTDVLQKNGDLSAQSICSVWPMTEEGFKFLDEVQQAGLFIMSTPEGRATLVKALISAGGISEDYAKILAKEIHIRWSEHRERLSSWKMQNSIGIMSEAS